MTRWFAQKVAYGATRFGFGVGRFAVRIFPPPWLFRFSDSLAALGFVLLRGFRSRSINNIRIAFGDDLNQSQARETVRRSLKNFFHAGVELALALESSPDEFGSQIPITGREHLDTALAKGNGVIVLSAHLGNFFLVGARLAIAGYPTHVLVSQPEDPRFSRLMDDYRLQVGQQTIHARPRRHALKQLQLVLRRNELAVVIADEYRKGNGIRVPLFGRTVLARRGPATVALRTGAAVVPACLVRQPDDSLRLIIEPELELVRSGESKVAIRESTLRITQWLERTVRAYPDQWNWMNIRWWETQDSSLVAKEHRFKESDFAIRGH